MFIDYSGTDWCISEYLGGKKMFFFPEKANASVIAYSQRDANYIG